MNWKLSAGILGAILLGIVALAFFWNNESRDTEESAPVEYLCRHPDDTGNRLDTRECRSVMERPF